MEASGFSLWLVPGGPAYERFAALIAGLAGRYTTPAFEPHVTLLGSLPGPEDALHEKCAELSRHLRPLALRPTVVEHGKEYFRCVFVEVEATPELMAAHERARELLGGRDEPYRPHLSLLYGDFSDREKETILGEIPKDLGGAFEVGHLDLVSTAGPPERWRRAGRFPLEQS